MSTTIYAKVNGSVIATFTSKNALTGGFSGLLLFDSGTFGVDSWEGGDVTGTTTVKRGLLTLGAG